MESEQGKQAELKKIIMVYQNQVLVGDTVADALSKLSLNPSTPSQPDVSTGLSVKDKNDKRKAEILKRLEDMVREQQQLLQELHSL